MVCIRGRGLTLGGANLGGFPPASAGEYVFNALVCGQLCGLLRPGCCKRAAIEVLDLDIVSILAETGQCYLGRLSELVIMSGLEVTHVHCRPQYDPEP